MRIVSALLLVVALGSPALASPWAYHGRPHPLHHRPGQFLTFYRSFGHPYKPYWVRHAYRPFVFGYPVPCAPWLGGYGPGRGHAHALGYHRVGCVQVGYPWSWYGRPYLQLAPIYGRLSVTFTLDDAAFAGPRGTPDADGAPQPRTEPVGSRFLVPVTSGASTS